MVNNKFIDVPQDTFADGDFAGSGAATRSSSISAGDSSCTSTAPPHKSIITHNPDSVPSSDNAFQLVSGGNNMDRSCQVEGSSTTRATNNMDHMPQGESFLAIRTTNNVGSMPQPRGSSNTGENRRVPQSTASVEPCLPQLPAFIPPSSSAPRSNLTSSVSLNSNSGRIRWNRELHRPQPRASISAFAESSKDAQARLARQDADCVNRRVICYADYDDDPKIEKDRDVLSEDIQFVTGSDYSDEQEGDPGNGDDDAEYEDDDGKHETVEDDIEEYDVPKQQHSINKSKRIRISGIEPQRRQLENDKNQNPRKRSKEDAQRPLLVAEGVTCSFGDCTLKSPFRRTISAFFGRNKKGGRDVPVRIWLHICRKHYQRTKYRDKNKYVNAQCDRIEAQFDRLEEWSNATLLANQGPHIDYWTTALGKKEADYQASQKNADDAHAKTVQGKGKAKASAQEEDEDKSFIKEEAINEIFDQEDNIWHAPAWLVALQGHRLSFEEIRKVFARLRLETQSIPNRTLPPVEFLPHLIFLGNYQPKKVTYTKRNRQQSDSNKNASPRKRNVNDKSTATAIKVEESDHEEDEDGHYMWEDEQEEEDYGDVMADADENHEYRKRERDDPDNENGQEYKRRRVAAPARCDSFELTDALVQSSSFEIRPRQVPTPSQRHMEVQQPRNLQPAPAPVKRARYIPSWQRLQNNPLPVQDKMKDGVEAYQPPIFTPRGLAKKNYG